MTTEANPESTSPELLARLRDAGFTRLSLGMQSMAPHVLAALDRVHSPGRALAAAAEARAAGFEHVNLDLIYGTPGETDDDLARSVDAAIGAGVDHVSAYALVVEDGTALARRVRRGELPAPDDDVLADRYELLDARLSAAGFDWYEVSNWSRARRGVPTQPRLLGRRRVVGCGTGRARLHRRHAMVERQAPQRLCATCSPDGELPVGGLRGAGRTRAAHRGRDAAAAAARRAAGRAARRRGAVAGRRSLSRTGCCSTAATRWC